MADSEAAAALLDELAAVDRQAGARSRRPSAAPLTPGWRVLDGLTASDVLDVVAHLVTRPDRRHAPEQVSKETNYESLKTQSRNHLEIH